MTDDLRQQVCVAFDTETTGLGPSSRIVEVAAIRFVGAAVLATFQQLVDPGMAMPAGAHAVHGIGDADLAGQPSAGEVLPAFCEFVADTPLLAHNASFDLGMLTRECLRVGLPLPANPVFDTRSIAQAVGLRRHGVARDGANGSYSLGALLRALDLSTEGLHRALADADGARRLFLACLSWAPHVRTLADLVAMAGPPRTSADLAPRASVLPAPLRSLEARIGQQVLIRYAGGSKGIGPRPVTPQAFFAQGEQFYLEALCHLDNEVKVFRADRILHVEPVER